jgi:DNA-binding CsgD family transcriptional regulator
MTRRRRLELSPRQVEIVARLARGEAIKEIADALDISYWTATGHLADARRRARARNNAQLVARFLRGQPIGS